MNNVILMDFKAIERDKRRPRHRPSMQTWSSAVEMVNLRQEAELVVRRMAEIDCLEMLLIIERILQPHRKLK